MFLTMLPDRRPHLRTRWWSAALLLVLASFVNLSCANLTFKRDTVTSGTFESTALAFTLISFDLPKGAMLIARENVSDANLANMVVTETKVVPYLGPFDFLLDIIGVRWARVKGTWGAAPKAAGG
jgi:hypothetical protein